MVSRVLEAEIVDGGFVGVLGVLGVGVFVPLGVGATTGGTDGGGSVVPSVRLLQPAPRSVTAKISEAA